MNNEETISGRDDMEKTPRKKKLVPTRHPMRERDPEARVLDFQEVPLGYTAKEAMAEAVRCLDCKNRPCKTGCPVEIDCGGFLDRIAEGNFKEAARLVKEKNLLPGITGRVCPQTEQCEGVCLVGKKGTSVGIGDLERFVADWEREHGTVLPEKAASTGKSVGVIGSGPSGLTVAADLVQLGHGVVIYEALHEPGGVLVYGIPEFRLPKAIVAEQIQGIKRLGVEIRLNQVIGNTLTVEELLERHDAVFVGVGAGAPIFMDIAGENLIGVYSANEYLTRANLMRAYQFPAWDTPLRTGSRVAGIGGGNVAMDSARRAIRLGAEAVTLIYRRSREEMPARKEEIRHAEEEGVVLEFLQAPTRILPGPGGSVKAIELIHMELGSLDASGRRRPVPREGSGHILEVDSVIVAIGQKPNPMIAAGTPGLETERRGYLVVDPETMATTMPGVYAGGDIAGFWVTVIGAMSDGRKAANSIHATIMGG